MSVIVKNNFVMGKGGGGTPTVVDNFEDYLEYKNYKPDVQYTLNLTDLHDYSSDVQDNVDYYKPLLGDSVTTTINSVSIEYIIVDLARYDKVDGSGKAGFVLMPKTQILSISKMSSSNTTSGGWASTSMRSYLFGLTRPSQIVRVKVPYVDGTGTTVSYADDYYFLPSYGELFGKTDSGNKSVEGDIFAGATNSNTWRIRYNGTSAQWYWLRSVYSSDYFWRVGTDGNADGNRASSSGGVVPCFCI